MWSKLLNIIFILLAVLFLILLFTQKDKLNNYLSKEIRTQTEKETQNTIKALVDSLYNYQTNNKAYQITFLELGAKGCVACRKMEFVLEEVRMEYPAEVKVVFLNILQAENQELMKYYGVAAIPTQILLDGEGKEYFRNTGYISFSELRGHLESKLKIDKNW